MNIYMSVLAFGSFVKGSASNGEIAERGSLTVSSPPPLFHSLVLAPACSTVCSCTLAKYSNSRP